MLESGYPSKSPYRGPSPYGHYQDMCFFQLPVFQLFQHTVCTVEIRTLGIEIP